MVGKILPEALEDSADMVPYCKLIIEFAGGSSMLDICPEERLKSKNVYSSTIQPKSRSLLELNNHLTGRTHRCRTSLGQAPAV